MTDPAGRRAAITAWIDGWMSKVGQRAADYRAQGMPAEQANERAVFDIRMEIRRAPPINLERGP